MTNYYEKYLKYKSKYFNLKGCYTTMSGGIVMDILVICSGLQGADFNLPKNKELFNYLYTIKPNYTFMNAGTGSSFPGSLEKQVTKGIQYDAIWFAGCNVFSWIFRSNALQALQILYDGLKPDGKIVITENIGLIQKLINPSLLTDIKYTLTITLEQLYYAHSNNLRLNKMPQDEFNIFTQEWNTKFNLVKSNESEPLNYVHYVKIKN